MSDDSTVECVRRMLACKTCPRYSNNVAPCGGTIELVVSEEELYVRLSITCQKCSAYEMTRIGHEEAEANDLTLVLVAAEARSTAALKTRQEIRQTFEALR